MTAPSDFASYTWILRGLTRSDPAWLETHEGRLRLVAPDAVVFDVTWSEVTDVVFPWYYFGGGMKLRAAGIPYRLSFVKPNGAEYAAGRALAGFGNPGALLYAASKIGDIGEGRGAGLRWRDLLGTVAPPS
jgi:hypothetical protein